MTFSGSHEMPIRTILDELLGARISYAIKDTKVVVGSTGTQIEPDAVIDTDVVVEIESRTPKQIRGAIMDLLFHPRRNKLLIIRPMNTNAETIKEHCEEVFRNRIRADERFMVIVLRKKIDAEADRNAIRQGLTHLGVIS